MSNIIKEIDRMSGAEVPSHTITDALKKLGAGPSKNITDALSRVEVGGGISYATVTFENAGSDTYYRIKVPYVDNSVLCATETEVLSDPEVVQVPLGPNGTIVTFGNIDETYEPVIVGDAELTSNAILITGDATITAKGLRVD